MSERGRRVEIIGTVVSDKMEKTVGVEVFRTVRHPKYSKYVKKSTVLKAHDESESANPGDVVKLVETRPLSKSKRWMVTEVLSRKA